MFHSCSSRNHPTYVGDTSHYEKDGGDLVSKTGRQEILMNWGVATVLSPTTAEEHKTLGE